jgi:hypothetical protein
LGQQRRQFFSVTTKSSWGQENRDPFSTSATGGMDVDDFEEPTFLRRREEVDAEYLANGHEIEMSWEMFDALQSSFCLASIIFCYTLCHIRVSSSFLSTCILLCDYTAFVNMYNLSGIFGMKIDFTVLQVSSLFLYISRVCWPVTLLLLLYDRRLFLYSTFRNKCHYKSRDISKRKILNMLFIYPVEYTNKFSLFLISSQVYTYPGPGCHEVSCHLRYSHLYSISHCYGA